MRLKTATLVALLALIPIFAGGCGLISARSGARNKRAAAQYARSYKARATAANQASLSDPGTAKLYKELVAEAPRYLSAVRFLMELKHFWALYDDEASGLKRQVIARFGDVELPLGAYIGMYGARAKIEGLTDLYIRRLRESLRVRRSQDRAGPRPNWSRWRSVEVRPRLGTYGREALIAALGRRVWSQASYARAAALLLAQADKALGGGADQPSRAAPVSRGQRLRAERCAKLKADMMAILAKPKKRGRLSAIDSVRLNKLRRFSRGSRCRKLHRKKSLDAWRRGPQRPLYGMSVWFLSADLNGVALPALKQQLTERYRRLLVKWATPPSAIDPAKRERAMKVSGVVLQGGPNFFPIRYHFGLRKLLSRAGRPGGRKSSPLCAPGAAPTSQCSVKLRRYSVSPRTGPLPSLTKPQIDGLRVLATDRCFASIKLDAKADVFALAQAYSAARACRPFDAPKANAFAEQLVKRAKRHRGKYEKRMKELMKEGDFYQADKMRTALFGQPWSTKWAKRIEAAKVKYKKAEEKAFKKMLKKQAAAARKRRAKRGRGGGGSCYRWVYPRNTACGMMFSGASECRRSPRIDSIGSQRARRFCRPRNAGPCACR